MTGNAEASSAKTHSNARTMYALTQYGMRAPHERNFDHLSWLEMSVATRKQEVIKLKDRGGGNPPVTGTCSRELSAVTVVAVEGTSAVCASCNGPQEEASRTASPSPCTPITPISGVASGTHPPRSGLAASPPPPWAPAWAWLAGPAAGCRSKAQRSPLVPKKRKKNRRVLYPGGGDMPLVGRRRPAFFANAL